MDEETASVTDTSESLSQQQGAKLYVFETNRIINFNLLLFFIFAILQFVVEYWIACRTKNYKQDKYESLNYLSYL